MTYWRKPLVGVFGIAPFISAFNLLLKHLGVARIDLYVVGFTVVARYLDTVHYEAILILEFRLLTVPGTASRAACSAVV